MVTCRTTKRSRLNNQSWPRHESTVRAQYIRRNFQPRVPKAMFRPTAAGVAAISVWVENGGIRISRVAGLARRFTNEIADQIGRASCRERVETRLHAASW